MEPEGIVEFQSANSINDIHDLILFKEVNLVKKTQRATNVTNPRRLIDSEVVDIANLAGLKR
jgi:hypothetical protein